MRIKHDVAIVDLHAGKLVVEPTQKSRIAVNVENPATIVGMFVEPGTKPFALLPFAELWTVVVPSYYPPDTANILPATIEVSLVQLLLAVPMVANAFELATPQPLPLTGETVSVLIVLHLMPVGTNTLPATIEVSLEQRATAVQMAANTSVATPPPPCPTGETVGVGVASVQVPFASDIHPVRTSPTLEATEAVLMAALAPETTPEVAGFPVVGVSSVQPPLATNPLPVTLIIAVQTLVAVPVDTDAFVAISPLPLEATVELVVVGVPLQQSPPPTNEMVTIAFPLVEHALAIQMSANAFAASPPLHHVSPA